MSHRVVIACGGTGGHLFPGIAVAGELQRRGHAVLCLISEKRVDAVASEGHPELRFETISAVAMPRPWSPAMVRFLFRFWRTLRRCRRIVSRFEADAVLGMGGFTSMPPILAGRRVGARTFVHESNAVPGKANRMTARFCDAVLVGFEACGPHFGGRETHVVGTPVRPELIDGRPGRAEARAAFGLDPDAFTLLVVGGSQGARGINRAVCSALPLLNPASPVQIIHLCGSLDREEVERAYASSTVRHWVAPFCREMGEAYAAADVVLARAGASSLAEIALFGLPSILVPYPFAADDHQMKNARIFHDRKAAMLIEERHLSGDSLSKLLGDLAGDSTCLRSLGEASRTLAVPDAAARIADFLEARLAGAGDPGSSAPLP